MTSPSVFVAAAAAVTTRDLAGPYAEPRGSRGSRRLTVLLAPPFAALVRHGCGTANTQAHASERGCPRPHMRGTGSCVA